MIACVVTGETTDYDYSEDVVGVAETPELAFELAELVTVAGDDWRTGGASQHVRVWNGFECVEHWVRRRNLYQPTTDPPTYIDGRLQSIVGPWSEWTKEREMR